MDKKIIWSNDPEQLEELAKDLRDESPEMSEYDAYLLAADINADYLADEMENLNKVVCGPILMIEDMGLWCGRRAAYGWLGNNVKGCLMTARCDYSTFYVDELGDLRCDDVHHDGTNHYLYRVLKPHSNGSLLCRKLLAGTATRRDITRETYRLGDIPAEVYGWKLRGKKPNALREGV